MEINDDFIREWHPRYDEIEHDESEYQRLVKVVSADLSSLKTLSKQTFLDIYRWKGALRIIGRVNLDAYDALYAPAFHRAAMRNPDEKLAVLKARRTSCLEWAHLPDRRSFTSCIQMLYR